MRSSLKASSRNNAGFTLVELMVVIPIVLLLVGGIIVIMVNTASEAITIRTKNNLTFSLQEAHNQIESDVETAVKFLATTDTAFDITTPQGRNNNTQDFVNASSSGDALLLHVPLTDRNPVNIDRNIVHIANSPHPCGSDDIYYNQPLLGVVVYFTEGDTLWRRTLMPPNYSSVGCATPWQRPSCQVGLTGAYCLAEDSKVLSGVSADSFIVKYLSSIGATEPIADASNRTVTLPARQTALDSAKAVEISITSQANAAGKEVSETSVLRSIKRNG